MRIHQIDVSGNIILLNNRIFVYQLLDNIGMSLISGIREVFHVTRICIGTRIGNVCKIDVMPETSIHIPKRITPFLFRSVRIHSTPPARVPVQPILTYDV
ncbi:hypothetical protein D3C80_1207480 [compost metagenome]